MMRRVCLFLCGILLCLAFSSCAEAPEEEFPLPFSDLELSDYLTLGEYRGLAVPASELAITGEEFTAQAESDFADEMRLTDRALAEGDRICLNYTAEFEGETYNDDTEDGFFLTLGKNELGIPGFDEGLIGKTPGEEVTLELSFPADYEKEPAYAGKAVTFTVTVQYIALPLPEITDELVSSHTTYQTAEEYREGVTKALSDVKKVNYLWNKVKESSAVLQYPEKEFENSYNDFLASYTQLAKNYNMSLAELVEASGETMADFYDEADRSVKDHLKEDLIIAAIARAEGMSVTAEEYEAGVESYYQNTASNYYLSRQLMENALGKDMLTAQVLSGKVLDLICDTAVVTED